MIVSPLHGMSLSCFGILAALGTVTVGLDDTLEEGLDEGGEDDAIEDDLLVKSEVPAVVLEASESTSWIDAT